MATRSQSDHPRDIALEECLRPEIPAENFHAEQALKELAAVKRSAVLTYTIAGPVNVERDVVCEIKIAGREVRSEDIDQLHDFVMLLAQAFARRQSTDGTQQPHETMAIPTFGEQS